MLLERMETLNEFMRENLVAMERIHAMSRVSLASLSTRPVGIERRQAQARVEDGHDARPNFLRRVVNGIGEKIWAFVGIGGGDGGCHVDGAGGKNWFLV